MPVEYLTIEHLSLKDIIRLFSKIEVSTEHFYKETPCWDWTACTYQPGYAWFWYQGRGHGAHRILYAWLVAPLPCRLNADHSQIDHLCRRLICCNPLHMEAVLPKVNEGRSDSPAGINARKTHCKRGHQFTDENTRISTVKGKKGRICRTCNLAWHLAWRQSHEGKVKTKTRNAKRYKKSC